MGEDRAIGANNDLLWKIKDDLRLFMKTTANHAVIHGRKSFESIGTPLRNRTNIIITRDESYSFPGCFVSNSIDESISMAKKLEQHDEIFILGGAQIYKLTLEDVDRMYISHVKGSFPKADAHFPEVNFDEWNLVNSRSYPQNEENEYAFDFCIYERKK